MAETPPALTDVSDRDNLRGIGYILLAAVFAVSSGSLVKLLSGRLPSVEIALIRGVMTLLLISPFLIKAGVVVLKSSRPVLMVARSINAAAIIALNIYAVGHMPLVDYTAVGFATPILVIPFSAILLKEKMRLRRTLATLIGFAGVMMIIRPTGTIAEGAPAALLATVLLAIGVLFVRMLSRTEPTIRLMAWSAGFAIIGLGYPTYAQWQSPDLYEWALLIIGGIAGTGTQFFIIRAYEAGNPTLIAPFDYSRILFATLAGFILFLEIPDLWTALGSALVVGSGIYIALRDVRMGRKVTTPKDPSSRH